MKNQEHSDVPLREIASTLRKTTETLGRELACPANAAPQWSKFEWSIAQSVVAMHGVGSLLAAKLRWAGPESWQQFLHEQRQHTLGRHARTMGLLQAVDMRARTAGLAFVALKGSALHAGGIYSAGERPMADIDLLIHGEDMPEAIRLLENCGYEPSSTTRRHQAFKPKSERPLVGNSLGEHVDAPIKVEVHTKVLEYLPIAVADITSCVFPEAATPGLNPYPSVTSLMQHLLLHAAGNMRARALRLIQLNDMAVLAARFDSGNWEELVATKVNGFPLWWAFPPLILTARYYPGVIPAPVLTALSADCPWLLDRRARRQCLTDVSWSNIRIEAFPGLEWSRTPLEALEYMVSRIKPSRVARSELQEASAQIPGSNTIGWYESSHRSRILRWVFSRPPRVQTMLSVRAALSRAQSEKEP
jgi:hypothetical protein